MNNVDYDLLSAQLRGLIGQEPYYVPALSNASALLLETLEDINWAGFYIVRDGQLVLGPFQGKVACIHIQKGKGVCGTAWETDTVQLVPNVHEFSGHIACDSASNSEIVVPIHSNGEVVAVLDIDSPYLNHFTDDDRKGLIAFADMLSDNLKWL